MTSLIILALVGLISRALGLVWEGSNIWLEAVWFGLITMFVVTGLSHFSPRLRPDFIRMVPPTFSRPEILVTLMGGLELLGAIGLLTPTLRLYAALGLALLLLAMLPANIYAVRQNLPISGRPPTPLVACVPLQGLYLALTLWAAFS